MLTYPLITSTAPPSNAGSVRFRTVPWQLGYLMGLMQPWGELTLCISSVISHHWGEQT